MNQNIPWGDRAGIATIESDQFTIVPLLSGEEPEVITQAESVDAGFAGDIPAFTPVERVAGGGIQPAVAASGNKFIGITATPYVAEVSTLKKVPVMKAGMFNPAALAWDASFDTDAKKAALFEDNPVLFLRAIGSPAS